MLIPGDKVLIDGETDIRKAWTVEKVYRDSTGMQYHFEGWPDPNEDVPGSRITNNVIYL